MKLTSSAEANALQRPRARPRVQRITIYIKYSTYKDSHIILLYYTYISCARESSNNDGRLCYGVYVLNSRRIICQLINEWGKKPRKPIINQWLGRQADSTWTHISYTHMTNRLSTHTHTHRLVRKHNIM